MQDRRGDRAAPLPDRLSRHRHLRHLRGRRRGIEAARLRRADHAAGPVAGRQPVGRPAREFRHHDQAVPCRALLGKRRRRSAVRLLWLDRDRPHPGGAARLLQCCRRRLRPGGHLRPARRSVDIRQPRRVDQAASVGLADPPRHDRDAASHRGARHPRRGRGACARRHQFQHAERADPPPSQGRAAGQVLDGVLHGDPAPGAARRAERVHRRGGGARRRQGDDREGRLRSRRGGGSRRLPPDDDDHRHRPQGRAAHLRPGRFRQGQPGIPDELRRGGRQVPRERRIRRHGQGARRRDRRAGALAGAA